MSARKSRSDFSPEGFSDADPWDDDANFSSEDVGDEEPADRPARPRNRPPAVRLLYHDDSLIVVDKPPGLSVASDFEDEPSVAAQLATKGVLPADQAACTAVYPLEADVSGVLLLARTAEVAEALRSRMSTGDLGLCILAIVRGSVPSEYGSIKHPVREAAPGRAARVDERHGSPAVTEWRLRDRFVGFALLECRPRTAVSGQIRVHLAASGFPPAADPTHSAAASLMLSSFKSGYHPNHRRPERPLIARLTLHAFQLDFLHPYTGAAHSYESPLPKDFRATLHQLDKYGRLPPPR